MCYKTECKTLIRLFSKALRLARTAKSSDDARLDAIKKAIRAKRSEAAPQVPAVGRAMEDYPDEDVDSISSADAVELEKIRREARDARRVSIPGTSGTLDMRSAMSSIIPVLARQTLAEGSAVAGP